MSPADNHNDAMLSMPERVARVETHVDTIYDALGDLKVSVAGIQKTVWQAAGAISVVAVIAQFIVSH